MTRTRRWQPRSRCTSSWQFRRAGGAQGERNETAAGCRDRVATLDRVSDGREIPAQLQADGIADDSLDYDEVVSELAAGRFPLLVLSPRRAQGIGHVILSARQHELIEKPVAVAREPWTSREPPPRPDVAWQRIATDLERTTGRTLVLALRWEEYSDGGFWMVDISVDGSALGGTNFDWDENHPEESLADRLCESFLHEEIWGGWPMCPEHRARPMWATTDANGIAVWACEAEPERDRVPIGELRRCRLPPN